MKKLLVSVLALCAFTAVACGSPNARVGTAGPNSAVGHYMVTSDPSAIDGGGSNAMVGTIGQLTNGQSGWMKTGSADTAWAPLNGGVMASYSTALIDATVAADNIPLVDMPLRPGYLFISRIFTLVIHDGAGTATGNMVWSIGNDASHQNVIGPVTTALATINSLIATAPYPSLGNGGGTGAFSDAGTAIVTKITTAPTGVTSLHCYFVVHGFWVPK